MKRMKWNKNKGRKNNYLCEIEYDSIHKYFYFTICNNYYFFSSDMNDPMYTYNTKEECAISCEAKVDELVKERNNE